jgi:hypothetical protein
MLREGERGVAVIYALKALIAGTVKSCSSDIPDFISGSSE